MTQEIQIVVDGEVYTAWTWGDAPLWEGKVDGMPDSRRASEISHDTLLIKLKRAIWSHKISQKQMDREDGD